MLPDLIALSIQGSNIENINLSQNTKLSRLSYGFEQSFQINDGVDLFFNGIQVASMPVLPHDNAFNTSMFYMSDIVNLGNYYETEFLADDICFENNII